MADLVFKQGILQTVVNINLNLLGSDTLREATATGNFQARDVVKISYPDGYQKAVYAICTDASGAASFKFDSNIYPVGLSSITATIFRYNTTDIDSVDVYRIGVDIENGLYSKAYTQYASNNSYSLIVPARRNDYFGISSTLVTNPDVVFANYCDGVAYGVGFSDGSFDTLNNRFKSSLEFNIATR
jgi:hypothetical protein